MRRFTFVFLCAVGLLLSPQILQAATYAVGTCKPSLPSFSTISAAVAAVPAGATVEVCPGTYAEQVVISTPLTLQGIASGDTNRAIIVPPVSGLAVNVTTSVFGIDYVLSFAAQLLVETGPVNFTNITVDGTNNNLNGSAWLAGIFYESGSFGAVNGITARYQIDDGQGVGVFAENGTSIPQTVTIQNSDIHDVDGFGILCGSNQTPPTLTATVKGNTVAGESVGPGISIAIEGATGTIEGNVVSDFMSTGIFDFGSSNVTISGNTTTNTEANLYSFGMDIEGTDDVVKSNLVLNNSGASNSIGIYLITSTATVQANKIVNSNIAIEFNCTSSSVSGNTIIDAATGIDEVPSIAVTNTYYGVSTIRSECSSAASAAKAKLKLFPKLLMP